jgi:hypothetical protein
MNDASEQNAQGLEGDGISTTINVQIVDGQEVFGRSEATMALEPPLVEH